MGDWKCAEERERNLAGVKEKDKSGQIKISFIYF